MTFVSYAQNLEDVVLWRALRDVRQGFYIDAGAWDPRIDSVTQAFYERGWNGINIEPDPAMQARLAEQRPRDVNLRIALADAEDSRPFYVFDGTGFSTLDASIARAHRDAGHNCREQVVQVGRLDQICARHAPAEIHFLKIDVEGSELAVLAGADLARYRPWIILVEATEPNSPSENHQAWESLILGAGYGAVYFDGLNRFYVADEHAARLAPAFSKPPNVFDDYISLASVRRALSHHDNQGSIDELRDRLGDADRQRQALWSLETRLREAETKAIEAEMQSRLVAVRRAEAAAVPDAAQDAVAATDALARDVYYDAGLLLHFGTKPPVGIVRVEQYVAELLARDPAIRLHFVIFDQRIGAYRDVSPVEHEQLCLILFGRYLGGKARDVPLQALPPPAEDLLDDDGDDAEPELFAEPPPAAADQDPAQRPSLARRVHNVSRMQAGHFDRFLTEQLLRRMPIEAELPTWKRLGLRVARRGTASGLRLSHKVLRLMAAPVQAGRTALTHLVRIDAPPEATPPLPASAALEAILPLPPEPIPEADNTLPAAHAFRKGDLLISIANAWDYMDYGYLTDLVRRDEVRFVSVIYDVIAMEMPFTTPAVIHPYHLHWVELGHVAAHLVAISQHSLRTYREFIAAPNDLDPPMSCAYLPNFLHERRDEIGETPVPELAGRRFVVFCSTIETRKNHQTLLHAWERLRQRVPAEQLPVLVFVGSWGWGTETVRLLVERNWRLRDHLRVLNNLSDAELIWLYRNSLFTAFPALAEGFGLAAAESLSFGTPVVVADCPALVEASEGLMPTLDPLDVPAWVEELHRLITDDAYLAELRQRAGQYRGVDYNAFAHALRDALLHDDQATGAGA